MGDSGEGGKSCLSETSGVVDGECEGVSGKLIAIEGDGSERSVRRKPLPQVLTKSNRRAAGRYGENSKLLRIAKQLKVARSPEVRGSCDSGVAKSRARRSGPEGKQACYSARDSNEELPRRCTYLCALRDAPTAVWSSIQPALRLQRHCSEMRARPGFDRAFKDSVWCT